MSAVRYSGVRKTFERFTALNSLDLTVPDGSFMALLGPSGCGKTTALRILAGLDTPTSGRVLIGDRDVTWLQPRDRDIATVFQGCVLYPHMTIAGTIGYPLRVRNVARAAISETVCEIAAILEIDHLLDRRPLQLSGGQRQRVALARAIVGDPAALLMDEPLSNLHARLRLTMSGVIKRLCHRHGLTTLYVTHDHAEALKVADLIAVLKAGELQQVATPDEIYERPANRFVATFVGNPPMNVIKAAVTDRGLNVGGIMLALRADRHTACVTGAITAMGMRPEDLRLVALHAPGAMPCEIYGVEPQGDETLVEVRVGGERLWVRAVRGFTARVGSQIGVGFDADDACFFDANGSTVVYRVESRRCTTAWY